MRVLRPDTPWADTVIRAAAVLYDAGAAAVWLFGSLARGQAADRLSDLDLAVEGLPGGSGPINRAARELNREADIVRLESATATMRWEIIRNRILVPRVASTGHPSSLHTPLPDSLAGLRTCAVAQLIREAAPRAAIDFGCGTGWLLAELARDARVEQLTGVDFDPDALARARRRIARASGPGWNDRVTLCEGLITHRDPAYLGHDAAAAVEVIEHLEPAQLRAFVGVLFDFVRPARAVLTTPNAEYSVPWPVRHPRGFRHPDHRFEWSRAEFAGWANAIARNHGYEIRIEPVGAIHPAWGPPTQLAVFDRGD